jgi:hypothetical protein
MDSTDDEGMRSQDVSDAENTPRRRRGGGGRRRNVRSPSPEFGNEEVEEGIRGGNSEEESEGEDLFGDNMER